jgi:hypothetical protein
MTPSQLFIDFASAFTVLLAATIILGQFLGTHPTGESEHSAREKGGLRKSLALSDTRKF